MEVLRIFITDDPFLSPKSRTSLRPCWSRVSPSPKATRDDDAPYALEQQGFSCNYLGCETLQDSILAKRWVVEVMIPPPGLLIGV